MNNWNLSDPAVAIGVLSFVGRTKTYMYDTGHRNYLEI